MKPTWFESLADKVLQYVFHFCPVLRKRSNKYDYTDIDYARRRSSGGVDRVLDQRSKVKTLDPITAFRSVFLCFMPSISSEVA